MEEFNRGKNTKSQQMKQKEDNNKQLPIWGSATMQVSMSKYTQRIQCVCHGYRCRC
ncbi:hypothetical protein RND71_012616 [Anisodus tanguticus]|uniref:Uncharacterized protein n=1 Tax=Anisodus tanguticus TaxID=243964 RepID=A0AAE1SFZ7_9SOLA|nr:hypothetical protein RND71_012616 [Anisodus tanguticus]